MLPARTHAGILATVKELDDYFARLPTEMLGGLVISSVPIGTGMDGIEIGGMDAFAELERKANSGPCNEIAGHISAFTTD